MELTIGGTNSTSSTETSQGNFLARIACFVRMSTCWAKTLLTSRDAKMATVHLGGAPFCHFCSDFLYQFRSLRADYFILLGLLLLACGDQAWLIV